MKVKMQGSCPQCKSTERGEPTLLYPVATPPRVLQIVARLPKNEPVLMDAVPQHLQWADRTWVLAAAIDITDGLMRVFAKVVVCDIIYSNYSGVGGSTFNELYECRWDTAGTRLDRLFYVRSE